MEVRKDYPVLHSAGGQGFRYEIKMTALIGLRLLNRVEEFYLASNCGHGGIFDDLVFAAKAEGEWSTWFIQLKHKSTNTKKKITLTDLVKDRSNFNLLKYFNSYKDICLKLSSGSVDPILGINAAHKIFVIFTNAILHDEILQRDHDEFNMGLLSTNEVKEQNIKFSLEKYGDVLENMRRDESIQEFLDRLIFCSRQADEGNIDILIQNEIRVIVPSLTISELKLVSYEWLGFIQQWWNTGRYLVKEDVQSTLFRFSKEAQHGKKKDISVTFMNSFLEFIREQIGREKLINFISHVSSSIMCMALLKQLGFLDAPHINFSLQNINRHEDQKELLAYWRSHCNVTLVVDCETLAVNEQNIVSFIKALEEANLTNTIILVSTKDNSTANDISTKVKAIKKKFNCTLKNLNDESKRMLLGRDVLFQGHKTTLSSLIPKGSNILDDVFDMASMTQLLLGRMVDVGLKPIEHIPYYVLRMLTRRSCVSPSFFTDPQIKACFALSMITLENAIASFPPEIGIVSSLNLIDSMEFIEQRIIILEGDPETEFEALSKRVNLPFHWFEKSKKRKLWQWRKSTRNIEDVSRSVESVLDYSPTDIILKKDKVVVITAEPGMGKSTLVQHIAAETKRLLPHVWVITLALNDFTENLVKPEFLTNTEACTKDLIAAAAGVGNGISKFDARLFNQCYDVTGEMVVLLDGFDEITPYYTKQGLALLRTLQKSKVARVWVTARPVLCDSLEKATSTLSYNIKPFDRKDQVQFLQKYWKGELPGINDVKVKEFTEKLLALIHKSFDKKFHQFPGIPLQTRMLAEVFLNDLYTFNENGVFRLKDRLNFLQLFEEFIVKKYGIQMEKAKMTGTNASARIDQKVLEEVRERYLMKLGLLTLLPQAICKEVNPATTEEDVVALKDYVCEGNEKTGIILSFSSDTPQFIHRTFAEYFVALFFAKSYDRNRKFLSSDMFFSMPFHFVKYFFERILAGTSDLHKAVLERQLADVKSVLSTGVPVNGTDAGGRTALHLASAQANSQEIINTLLAAGALVDVEDSVLGWRPIQYAIKIGAVENIAPLLEEGKDMQIASAVPVTSDTLLKAVQGDYFQLMLHLLENEIYSVESLDELSPQMWIGDTVSEGLTILHLAAAYDAEKILRYLLRKDHRDSKLSLIECKDSQGMTPLILAAVRGCHRSVNVLLKARANPLATTRDGKNLSQLAVEAQNLNLLLSVVSEAQTRGIDACSFLFGAVSSLIADKTDWSCRTLIDLINMFPMLKHNKTTENSTLIAAAAAKGNALVVRRLWELHVVVNDRTPHGTPLHIAVAGGHEDVIIQLLACPRIHVDAVDEEGCTPLFRAVAKGLLRIFQLLVDAGANIYCTAEDGSDLTHAVASKFSCEPTIFDFLVKKGFDFKKTNNKGLTGLSLLHEAKAFHLVKVLDPSFYQPWDYVENVGNKQPQLPTVETKSAASRMCVISQAEYTLKNPVLTPTYQQHKVAEIPEITSGNEFLKMLKHFNLSEDREAVTTSKAKDLLYFTDRSPLETSITQNILPNSKQWKEATEKTTVPFQMQHSTPHALMTYRRYGITPSQSGASKPYRGHKFHNKPPIYLRNVDKIRQAQHGQNFRPGVNSNSPHFVKKPVSEAQTPNTSHHKNPFQANISHDGKLSKVYNHHPEKKGQKEKNSNNQYLTEARSHQKSKSDLKLREKSDNLSIRGKNQYRRNINKPCERPGTVHNGKQNTPLAHRQLAGMNRDNFQQMTRGNFNSTGHHRQDPNSEDGGCSLQ